ncbi:MAG: 50S ribosomal protein L15 [Coriobacteriales bacterium]|jgi:large subunit ribosomal protein L15|nr:50S ribosomal protein L15 [Coriobacteriales bacterium]
MQLVDLKPAKGATKARKRVGRGEAAGGGKTAGRGLNGQKSRSGGGKGAGFEGGQTPLARRLPKLPGFRNFNKEYYLPVNLGRLDEKFADGETVNAISLVEKGIIKNSDSLVKILGGGKLTKKLTVQADKFSASAQDAIVKAGGKYELIGESK